MSIVTPELILFAKQPVAGEVKTRLQPQYTPEQAANIAQYFIEASVVNAVNHWAGPVSLYVSPDITHPIFHRLAEQFDLRLYRQEGADLGLRMHVAIKDGIERNGAAAVMGCDIPHCPPTVIKKTYEMLIHGDSLLGPTEDGGFYVIGLQQSHPELFSPIEWGTVKVLSTILERFAQLGLDMNLLPILRDLDTPEDISIVTRDFPALRNFMKLT